MARWYSISCAQCGTELRVCEDWDNPPRLCKSCKEERDAQWSERSCEGCGATIRVHRDWSHPPRRCQSCKAAEAARWYDKACEDCGTTIRVCRDWDRGPRFCKGCKQARAEKWYDVSCRHCGGTMRVCRDWERIPEYHPKCAWTEVMCEICSGRLRIHRAWEQPPRAHKECFAAVAPKDVSCSQCGKTFTISTGLQIACKKNGWDPPRRCQECKQDALLIKGAIGALRDEFPFPLETTIEQRGLLFTDKVAVVRNRRTGELVAEVRMSDQGIFFTNRVAVATDSDGNTLSKTREDRAGILQRRVADTYEPDGRTRTHRTRMVERGVLSRKQVAETTRTGDSSGVSAATRSERRGVIFPRRVLRTDRE